MRQQVVSQTGTGSSAIIPMNLDSTPFNVGFGVVATGTVTYTVQHTFDNPWTTASPTWFNHPTVASVVSTNADGNYAFPVAAIKVAVTSGAGTAQLTVIQAGIA
jgi:archaellum component FlaF (FlaF/FlaG flagellin family)